MDPAVRLRISEGQVDKDQFKRQQTNAILRRIVLRRWRAAECNNDASGVKRIPNRILEVLMINRKIKVRGVQGKYDASSNSIFRSQLGSDWEIGRGMSVPTPDSHIIKFNFESNAFVAVGQEISCRIPCWNYIPGFYVLFFSVYRSQLPKIVFSLRRMKRASILRITNIHYSFPPLKLH